MARLASQAAAGFFPCPPTVVDLFAAKLKPPSSGGYAILDPCAGEGAALEQLQKSTWAPGVYGIELDSVRAELAKSRCPNVIGPADFLSCKISHEAFSLVWCNPPYDSECGGGGRVEFAFLKKATPLLVTGGVMAWVIPERCWEIRTYREWFHQHYREVEAVAFPDEHRNFGEIIVVGVRRSAPKPESGQEYCMADEWRERTLPVSPGPKRFDKGGYTEDELLDALAKSPLNAMSVRRPEIERPPLPLNKGHLALILASGKLDGRITPPGEPPHVIRGIAKKKKYVASTTEEEQSDGSSVSKTVISERMEIVIRAAFQDGTIVTLGDGDNEESEAA